MSGAQTLIGLIVALLVAAIATTLYLQVGGDAQQSVPELETFAEPTLVAVTGHNISNGSMRHVRIQVTSDEPIRVNDSLIILSTEQDQARLQYREGELNRSVVDGFYTVD